MLSLTKDYKVLARFEHTPSFSKNPKMRNANKKQSKPKPFLMTFGDGMFGSSISSNTFEEHR